MYALLLILSKSILSSMALIDFWIKKRFNSHAQVFIINNSHVHLLYRYLSIIHLYIIMLLVIVVINVIIVTHNIILSNIYLLSYNTMDEMSLVSLSSSMPTNLTCFQNLWEDGQNLDHCTLMRPEVGEPVYKPKVVSKLTSLFTSYCF